MLYAISLAKKARFQCAPNPCVGAILIRDGQVQAQGWHKGAGQAHAEVEALADAKQRGVNPAECSMLVTLEPCRHHGKTPPCTEALLEAGIRHVVIGALDPNPEASGGAQVLRDAGVQVEQDVAQQECLDLIDDFTTWKSNGMPYVSLKLASTLDGRIATRVGNSRWITAESARQRVHELRARVQAVLVGGNTFYKDDPQLTSRLENTDDLCPRQPLAIVITSRLPEAAMPMHLLRDRPGDLIFWTSMASAASTRAEELRRKGVRIIGLPALHSAGQKQHMRYELDLAEGLRRLYAENDCHYVLCEGGGRLGLSLLQKGLVGELHLHLAPKILADNEAIPLFDGLAPLQIADGLQLRIAETMMSGEDLMLTLKPGKTG